MTACASYAINRIASKYLNAGEKVKKRRKLIETGTYDPYRRQQQSNRIEQCLEKSIYFEFQNWSIFKMNRKWRPTKSGQQIKDEQIGFMLE